MRIVPVKGSKGGHQVIVIYSSTLFCGTKLQCQKFIDKKDYGKEYNRKFDKRYKK